MLTKQLKHWLAMVAMLLCSLVVSAFEVDGIYYYITSKEDLTVGVTSGSTEYNGAVTIPATVIYEDAEYSVTSIGGWAFYMCYDLTTITIPESVTSIGELAFYNCINLTAINLPKNMISVGNEAFYQCENLTTLTIPENVTSIGDAVFRACSGLTSIIVAEGNTVYDSRGGCNAIIETNSNTLITGCSTTIIPENVTNIEGTAFYMCGGLTTITIPEGMESIGGYAFAWCDNLTAITLPDGVTSIGEAAFCGCSNLATINIPEGVTSIRNNTFQSCNSLTTITFPESVTSIEPLAFYGCGSLTTITCEATTPPTIGESNTFGYVDKSIPVYVPVGSVEAYKAAAYWSEFTNIQPVDDSSNNNGDSRTFQDWTSDNQGQSSSTSSETYTFDASEGDVLTFDWAVSSESNYDWFIATLNGSEIIKESGEVSGTYQYTFTSFESNTLIVQYTKDVSVNNGDDQAKVYNVVLITSSASMIASGTCGDNLTWRLTEEYELVIEGTGDMYDYEQDSAPWYEYCHMINKAILPDGVTSIGNKAFDGCSSLTSITIPESVTNIGEHAFYDCSSLTSVTIPESVTSIEGWAFCNCSSLTSITIPANVINIGYGVLMGCNGLVSVVVDERNPVYDSRYNCNAIIETSSNTLVGGCSITVIPNDITSIGNRAFCYCDFATISIPESVTNIEDYSFGASSLTSITIPEGVTSIGREAFTNCENLTAITIPSSVKSIGDCAFLSCNSLTAVHISSIETWCEISFSDSFSSPLVYAHNLYLNGELVKELVIPDGVTSIGNFAFYGCTCLTAITCKATTPPAIGGFQTFIGQAKSIPVYVPAGSVEAYKAAAYWSEFSNIQPLGNEYTLTVSAAGYATLYLDYAVAIPEEVEVYIASKVEGDRLMMTEVEGVLPANTGVIVRTKAGTYTFVESEDAPADVEGNLLTGTTTNTYITAASGYRYYVLAQKEDLVGMYRPKLTDGRFLNNANRAYLALDLGNLGIFDDEVDTGEEGGQLSNRLRFDFGGTTDVEMTTDNGGQTMVIYDLQGRRVEKPTKPGIYIVNGQKVMVR